MTIHTIDGLRISTEHVQPPIPVRDFDWLAVLDDEYDGADDAGPQLMGTGMTEAQAIEDLLNEVKAAAP